jgi:hypothetical protein
VPSPSPSPAGGPNIWGTCWGKAIRNGCLNSLWFSFGEYPWAPRNRLPQCFCNATKLCMARSIARCTIGRARMKRRMGIRMWRMSRGRHGAQTTCASHYVTFQQLSQQVLVHLCKPHLSIHRGPQPAQDTLYLPISCCTHMAGPPSVPPLLRQSLVSSYRRRFQK